jgi:hypothetical protein
MTEKPGVPVGKTIQFQMGNSTAWRGCKKP